MEEADRSGMQIPAKSPEIVAAKAVLVPSVIDGCNLSSKNEQKRRERSKFVDPHPFLQFHPFFNPGRVIPCSPTVQIYYHHARVKITSFSRREREGQRGICPKGRGEVGSEVSIAVLGGGQHGRVGEVSCGEFGDVVDEDEVGIEVDDTGDAEGEDGGEVGAGVVEGAVEGGANGGGDEFGDGRVVKRVELEAEEGE